MAETLLLFTSNMRPQYEQDALDVLAAPERARHRFRYQDDYVEKELLRRWGDPLIGLDALIVFSIQQQASYHLAAYVPLRFGTIIRADREGAILTIEFEVGDYALLSQIVHALQSTPRLESGTADPGSDPGGAVRAFSDCVRSYAPDYGKCPDGKISASVIDSRHVDGAIERGCNSDHWQQVVQLLSHTLSFHEALFVRVMQFESATSSRIETANDDGVFEVLEGCTYRLMIAYWQREFYARHYETAVDKAIAEIVGSARFEISSRYDLRPIMFHVLAGTDSRRGTFHIGPADGSQGASIDISFRVRKPIAKKLAAPIATLIALALIALPGLLATQVVGWVKIAAVVGIGIGVLARHFGIHLA